MRIFAVVWFFFLHPGSTNTSGIISFYADFLDEVELRANADRVRRAAQAADAGGAPPAAGGHARGPGGLAPGFLLHGGLGRARPRQGVRGSTSATPAVPKLEFVQGTGSIAGLGIQASALGQVLLCARRRWPASARARGLERASAVGEQSLSERTPEASAPQNLGMSVGYQVEGKLFLRWLANESSVNQSIVTTLFERYRWKRTTVDGKKSFSIYYPFIGICGALHLGDIAHVFTGSDELGIRSRLTLFSSRPSFKRRRQLREATDALTAGSATWKADMLANFYKLFQAHHPEFAPGAAFQYSKGFPLRVNTLEAGPADARFTETFDHHVDQQEESYLTSHEDFKVHGKKKTRGLRWALLFFLLESAMSPAATVDAWPTAVTAACVEAADEWVTYCDALFDVIQTALAPAEAAAAAAAPRPQLARSGGTIGLSVSDPWGYFTGLPNTVKPLVPRVMSILARYDKTWILSSQVRHLQPVSAICDGAGNDNVIYSVVYAAMALMLYFGLASVQLTRNATGPKNLVLNKRALVDGDVVPPRALAAIRVAPQESLPL